MGRGPRMGFVELPRNTQLYRRVRIGKRPCDYLVEARPARRVGQIRVRRIGMSNWYTWGYDVFMQQHEEVKA